MSRRIRCRSCQATFYTDDGQIGRPVACPKCEAEHEPPTGLTPAAGMAQVASVFVPTGSRRARRRGRWIALAVLILLTIAAVAVVVSWPTIQRWWHPIPPDPVEMVATAYLQALVDGDVATSGRLGTVDLPPAIRTYRVVTHEKDRDALLRGSFAPITAFHARVAETYTFDPSSGRFTPRNALGPAAETLDALHEAKAKAEESGLYKKMQSGDPNDLFDAAEGLAKSMASLSTGALAPRKLIPSYKQLVEDAKPPLPPSERALALDFAANRETWDQLLKRSFTTLKADGPFVLERAEVTASVIDSLGSSGDPPTPLHLTLTRFQLEGINTGWRVTSARREPLPPAPVVDAVPAAPSASPGESAGNRRD